MSDVTNGNGIEAAVDVTPLDLGGVPRAVAVKMLEALGLVLEVGYGAVLIEVQDGDIYVKPQPSYQFKRDAVCGARDASR